LGFEPRHPVTQKAKDALLGALVQTFAPERDPLVMSFDETLWNDVEGGGSLQRGSTETRCSQAASAS
jgi:hypothetical protein